MALNTADKIFIDVDDEINFIVEKINATERERVIVVVPQNAILVSSLVSMRILAKQMLKSKKIVIMVTEDAFGLKLAEQSDILATNKVSNVAPEMWEAAQIRKAKQLDGLKAKKDQLLTDRGIAPKAPKSDGESPQTDTPIASTGVPEVYEVELDPATGTIAAEQPIEETPVEENTDVETPTEIIEEPIADAEPEPEVKGPIQRTRTQPKLVSLGAFQVMAGGDISSREGTISANMEDSMPEDQPNPRLQATSVPARKSNYTGKDWSRYTRDTSKSFSLANIFPFKPKNPGERTPDMERSKRIKMIGIGVAVGLILLLIFGGGYLVAFQFSEVKVRITLKTAEVPIEQQITADVAVTELDSEKLIVPAEIITNEDVSISGNEVAKGESSSGNKAAGVIDIWNYTTNVVELPAGTVMENTTTGLKYVLTEAVTVPKSPGSTTSVITVAEAPDRRIEAEKFGTEYNIVGAGDQRQNFKVGNYPTSELIGKRFADIEGGTTETFKSVSQNDFYRMRNLLTESLQKQAKDKVINLVPAGYKLITGSEKFEVVSAESTPAVGERGDDFSLSLKGKVTALIVRQEYLEAAITELASRSQQSSEPIEVDLSGDIVMENVTREGNKATFTVSSNSSLRAKITESEIKQNISGKTLPAAESYLFSVEGIQSFKLDFQPEIVPESLRRVPTDFSRIRVTLN